MRTLPRMAWSLALLLPVAACARSTTPSPRGTTTIELSVVNGAIVVDPDSALAERNGNVVWRGADPGAVWVVVFNSTTPFANGQRVLNGGGNPSHAQAPIPGSGQGTVVHKYWVFYPDGSGGYIVEDPKLVIVDDMNR